jgi:hypothetical protein
MTITYGLRNPTTGRIIRLAENLAFHGDSSCHLSEAPELPYWKVENFADLVTTICEDRPSKISHRNVPEWRSVNPHECQPIGFITEVGRDVDGGDPVFRTERLVTFDLGIVLDLRKPLNRTVGIDTQHYGIMQTIFTKYDMDRIDTMSLALVWSNGPMHLRGDIGLTHDKGPARIIGVADLPGRWPLTPEQEAHKPFPDAKISLVLLDTAELVTWIDFDQIDPDNRLNAAA